jgi:hypothetical protein
MENSIDPLIFLFVFEQQGEQGQVHGTFIYIRIPGVPS